MRGSRPRALGAAVALWLAGCGRPRVSPPPYAATSDQIVEAVRARAATAPSKAVRVVVTGSGPDPEKLAQVRGDLAARVEHALAQAGFEVSRNLASPAQAPPPRTTTTSPVRQPETLAPRPDVVLFLGLDLARATVTFWFVDPAEYVRAGPYDVATARTVLRLE